MLGIKERTGDMQFTSRSLKTRLLELLMDTGETLKSRVNTRILEGGSAPQMNSNFNKGAPSPEPPLEITTETNGHKSTRHLCFIQQRMHQHYSIRGSEKFVCE